MTQTERIARGSIAVGITVLALKTIAWSLTGSLALFSDALESTVNVVTAIAALVAVRIAAAPPDRNHPWGHHKAEYLSAIAEGVMIVIAALAILWTAVPALFAPSVPDLPFTALLVSGAATVLNALWCRRLLVAGREGRSPALTADGQHLKADVMTSLGVICGVLLVRITGFAILDPILAIIVAGNILWSGWLVMRASLAGLMDEAVEPETLAAIHQAISDSGAGALEAHDIRTRHAGAATFVDFHLVMPGTTTVAASHALCDRIEAALKAKVPQAVVTIHVEPEDKAKAGADVVFHPPDNDTSQA